ncbi:cytochrome c oxidase subunit 8A, mitochondrial [Electrophorus electricus]|uniref:cytochrome c oxidase subunit 8A, mitochondrial n=1 Tax=Electrophorus electricus TaxID=8005 RepID=UPI000F0A5798|nr:cytochrome c oxidase subunit 8A, mitochondrial [Electrophorus electricus]
MLVGLSRALQHRSVNWPRVILQKRRCSIYSKPPKSKIGPGQSFFVMSMFAIALLTPAGWILHHIPEYRTRRQPPPT